jgi:hypothetical protein
MGPIGQNCPPMASGSVQQSSRELKIGFGAFLLLIFVVLGILFHNCFLPGYTLFSNDGPLGALEVQARHLPEAFSGVWEDLNSIGYREGGAMPSITYALLWLLGPVGFSKFYAPIVLCILGFSAWWFFRRLGLVPLACVLGGVAATLNSGFFSSACWGVASHPLTIALSYLALGALVDSSGRKWMSVILAGFAVGMGVVEGADIGAIFSIYVAGFALYQAWASDGQKLSNFAKGAARLGVIVAFAVFIAAHSISVLVTTQIKGVSQMQQDKETKQQNWDFATQWSLPKREALGFLVPGLFGYRMDTPDGGAYWGAVGRDPNLDRWFESGKQGPMPGGPMRFSGGGIYAGALVVLVACWTVYQGLRRKESAFSLSARRWIWFWLAVFVVSLLLAFGRFAPFYQLLYALPYFSTIRNPAKFTYVCNWALIVLFAYGIHGLYRCYMSTETVTATTKREVSGGWWQRMNRADRRWVVTSGVLLGIVILGGLIFVSSRDAFESYLQEVQFDPATARSIASFSAGQIALFLFFFSGAIVVVALIIGGNFRGKHAKAGAILIALLLAVDMGRADQPWVITWNYSQKYASNPILDLLRHNPFEHRVAGLPRWLLQVFQVPPQLTETEQYFRQLYGIEWTQHQFLFYNIQSLDVIQMPRVPEDLAAFEARFIPKSGAELTKVARHWELTNTRYLLGAAAFLDVLNTQFDPGEHRFHVAQRFGIEPKEGVPRPRKLEELTAVRDTNGPYAVFEFTGALPRVALYSNWHVVTNDAEALDTLASPSFEPARTVIVGSSLSEPKEAASNVVSSVANITSYAPKHIIISAQARTPTVLLLNDRYDPNWKVVVDGKAETVLRCNYIMRGVFLPAGSHNVEFTFAQPMGTFWISVSAVLIAICIGVAFVLSPDPRSERSNGTLTSRAKIT